MALDNQSARSFLLAFSKANHDTLKTIWIVVMGAAVANAVVIGSKQTLCSASFLQLTGGTAGSSCTAAGQPPLIQALLLLVAYIFVFIRFFYGDNRYVDWKYHHSLVLVDSLLRDKGGSSGSGNADSDVHEFSTSLQGFTSARQAVDVYFLIFQSILFVALSEAIVSPPSFFALFAVLLATNVVWLIIGLIFPRDYAAPILQAHGLNPGAYSLNPKLPASIWIGNNLVALVLMALSLTPVARGLFTPLGDPVFSALLAVVMLNNLISLTLAHPFYFPSGGEIFRELLRASPRLASGQAAVATPVSDASNPRQQWGDASMESSTENSDGNEATGRTDYFELLKEYWQPVCAEDEVAEPGAVRIVHICGKRIAVVRTRSGSLFAIDDRCLHRGVSFEFGEVGTDTISCPYHGWTYDRAGRCIARPFEKSQTLECALRAYPAETRYGFVFVYLGELSPPPLPRFDNLEGDGLSVVGISHEPIRASWLFVQDNAVDVTHTYHLHGKMSERLAGRDPTGFGAHLCAFGFLPVDIGIVKTWKYSIDGSDPVFGFGNPLVFPNMLAVESEVHWRVPIDEHRTAIFIASAMPPDLAASAPRKIVVRDAEGGYDVRTSFGQDAMALETSYEAFQSGASFRLGRSDYAIHLFRRMIRAQCANLASGGPLMARPADGWLRVSRFMGGYLPSTAQWKGPARSAEHWGEILNRLFVEFDVEPLP